MGEGHRGALGSNHRIEFENLSDRGGHGGYLAEKYCSYRRELSRLPCSYDLAVVNRRRLAISSIISKRGF